MRYEITVQGRAERAIASALGRDLEVSTGPSVTILRGDLADQSALYGVLNRIERLGLVLLDVHRTDPGAPDHRA
ncbi:MAG: hypothetical protein ACRD12_15980 [Acidimicrobiales bacterium]